MAGKAALEGMEEYASVQGQETFPRRERLTRPGEYRAVFEHGRKSVGPEFVCYFAKREGPGRKFGMAVSRKVGNAVTRNRVKRYLREIYRRHRADLWEDVSIVVVARPAASSLSFVSCQESVQRLFRKGGALRG